MGSANPADSGRNVVLIVLDSVRKDYFDMFSPRLRGRTDVSFEQCRAASSWSTPSHASMLTGELPHRHGIDTYQRSFSQLKSTETFLHQLDGYESIGVTTNFYAGSAFGFDSLFDEFVDIDPDLRYPDSWEQLESTDARMYVETLRQAVRSEKPLQYLANGVSALLRDRFDNLPVPSPYDNGAAPTCRAVTSRAEAATEPFFIFVNFMDVHQPLFPHVGLDRSLHAVSNRWSSRDDFYDVKWDINARGNVERHREFLANYRALYGAAVEYLDRRVDALIDTIDRVTDNETTYVITSDHGENLGFPSDEYTFEHTGTLTEAALHVPLSIINAPAGAPASISDYASHLRLGELITGLARGSVPDITNARIPAEVMGLSPGTSSLDESDRSRLDRTIRAVYEADRKIVWSSDGQIDAYRLAGDRPSWQQHVAGDVSVPDWAAQFFDVDIDTARETALERDGEGNEALDPQAIDRLEDLGYL
jgi:arylsulfatase A-like enzyme